MATRQVERLATRGIEHVLDDRGLVLAFQAGDRAAYDVIFQRYGPMTDRICRRYLINPHDAEEATQETMLRVLRSLSGFNGRYNLRAWVARIATNLCLDRLRKEIRKSNGEDLNVVFLEHQNDEASAKADPGEVLERVVRREEIKENLAKLPESHRIALVLRDVEGFGHREIAEFLGTTPPRVKALLHRARKGFRAKWDGGQKHLGIVFLPFVWMAGWLRRAQGRMQELATSGAGASPQVATIASHGGDHMSAALAAVVLAGSVGFAAGNAPSNDTPDPAPRETVVFEAAAAPEVVTKQDVDRQRQQTDGSGKEKASADEAAAAPVPVEPLPANEPQTQTEEQAAAAEKKVLPEPEPQPSASPRPEPAAPAGFTSGFTSDWITTQPCGCADQPRIVHQILNVEEGEPAGFSTRIEGGALRDRDGQLGWPIEVTQTGTKAEHTFEFVVHTPMGAHTYTASGPQVSRERTTWGGWKYGFAGTYQKKDGPQESTVLPSNGTYTASLTFAVREGRLVDAVFSLGNGEYGE